MRFASGTFPVPCFPGLTIRISIVISFASLAASSARGQQLVTDDAAIVDYRACQLEAWHGRDESWIMPACQVASDLEITAAVGLLANGGREVEYLLEGKYIYRSVEDYAFGFGIVTGIELHPGADGGAIENVYAFLPLSWSLFDGRLLLHQNTGWAYESAEAHERHRGHANSNGRSHVLTWGFRADGTLHDRFSLIAELFGENRLFPQYQLGFRSTLLTDRLMIDLTYGGHTQGDLRGLGPVIGIAWTPPPFL